MERKFYDIETGETVTEEQLYAEYCDAVARGEMEAEECAFSQYIGNCMACNGGTLESIVSWRVIYWTYDKKRRETVRACKIVNAPSKAAAIRKSRITKSLISIERA